MRGLEDAGREVGFCVTDVLNALVIARQEVTARRRFLVEAFSGAVLTLTVLNFYFFWWTPFPLSELHATQVD